MRYACELPKENARQFKEYCRNNYIPYEPSECGDLIHFELDCDTDEMLLANNYIDEITKEE